MQHPITITAEQKQRADHQSDTSALKSVITLLDERIETLEKAVKRSAGTVVELSDEGVLCFQTISGHTLAVDLKPLLSDVEKDIGLGARKTPDGEVVTVDEALNDLKGIGRDHIKLIEQIANVMLNNSKAIRKLKRRVKKAEKPEEFEPVVATQNPLAHPLPQRPVQKDDQGRSVFWLYSNGSWHQHFSTKVTYLEANQTLPIGAKDGDLAYRYEDTREEGDE